MVGDEAETGRPVVSDDPQGSRVVGDRSDPRPLDQVRRSARRRTQEQLVECGLVHGLVAGWAHGSSIRRHLLPSLIVR